MTSCPQALRAARAIAADDGRKTPAATWSRVYVRTTAPVALLFDGCTVRNAKKTIRICFDYFVSAASALTSSPSARNLYHLVNRRPGAAVVLLVLSIRCFCF